MMHDAVWRGEADMGNEVLQDAPNLNNNNNNHNSNNHNNDYNIIKATK